MSKIRVLVVDDAVVIRRIVSDVLSADPEIEVVGTAANGKIALARLEQLNPDLVTMDVEMPDMDGVETLRELRKKHRRLPVIMFSTLTERGAATTLDALAAGASDYVTKPANVGCVSTAMARIRDELIPKIKALCAKPTVAATPALSAIKATRLSAGRLSTSAIVGRGSKPIEIVVIGVSTGGPKALAEVFEKLPGDLPVPVLIVQHMPPVFTKLLADRLNQGSQLCVKEAEVGDVLKASHVYLAPGDFHMVLESSAAGPKIALNKDTPENSCRPAVDPMFRSAAKMYGASILSVILTGMGRDGLRGAQCIKEAGGSLLAQDEATSVVWGMPGAVVEAGLVDQVIPLQDMAREIADRVTKSRAGIGNRLKAG